jgi:hypothetical protein
MVRPVEVDLKGGKRTCPPLATPAVEPVVRGADAQRQHSWYYDPHNYTTAGNTSKSVALFNVDKK